MRRTAIITVAGESTRFRKSVGRDVLKCLYTERTEKETLLFRLVALCAGFDRIIIVGGYRFHDLRSFVSCSLKDFAGKITLIENAHFSDFGSGYSLYEGLREAARSPADEIVFSEGDLFVDAETFGKIVRSDKNIVTANSEPIEAKKSVAFYTSETGAINYIYDTNHCTLRIDGPFLAIHNSGQVWKFRDTERLFSITDSLTEEERTGTNLVIVQKYFETLNPKEYDIMRFKKWINCNTIEDYRKALEE